MKTCKIGPLPRGEIRCDSPCHIIVSKLSGKLPCEGRDVPSHVGWWGIRIMDQGNG